jgi:hypothetical protein
MIEDESELAHVLVELTFAIRDLTHGSHRHNGADFATKTDIQTLKVELIMKLSEVATVVAEIKKNNREAFTELSARLADLNQQIADLVAAATDPNVSDQQFLADLNDAKADAQALADIVPNPAAPPPAKPPGTP